MEGPPPHCPSESQQPSEKAQAAARAVTRRWMASLKARKVREATHLLLRLGIHTDELERATEAIAAQGAEGIGTRDPSCVLWTTRGVAKLEKGDCVVECRLADHAAVIDALRRLKSSLGRAALAHDVTASMPESWEKERDGIYKAVEIGTGFWVVPVWSDPPIPTAMNLVLEPSYACWPGKGSVDGLAHPATILVMKWIREAVAGNETVMDYGTGSGVLAIAALMSGASFATGVDIDPVCISTAHRNMQSNGFLDNYCLLVGGDLDGPDPLDQACPEVPAKYDICIANVLMDHMQQLRKRLLAYTSPGGTLVLSGMLVAQLPAVRDSFGLHLSDVTVSELDGWARLCGTVI